MEDMTKMVNKAIVPEHNKLCWCEECITTAAVRAKAKVVECNKEVVRSSAS